MPPVASAKLCKQLYELTTWGMTQYYYELVKYEDGNTGYQLVNPAFQEPQTISHPAYEAGHLLRHLYYHNIATIRQVAWDRWSVQCGNSSGYAVQKEADTLENALCLVLIDLYQNTMI